MILCPSVTDWKTQAERGVRCAEVICEQGARLNQELTSSAVGSRTQERRQDSRAHALPLSWSSPRREAGPQLHVRMQEGLCWLVNYAT